MHRDEALAAADERRQRGLLRGIGEHRVAVEQHRVVVGEPAASSAAWVVMTRVTWMPRRASAGASTP